MPPKPPSSGQPAGNAGGELKTLGKYKIERVLGAGGMGTVYLGVDPSLNRAVAIKVLPQERAENPILVRRFKAEGQAAAVLEHKNIIRVYDAGEADGYLYLALEYVDGIDVLEWMRKRGKLPVKRSLDIIRQMTEALKHAYAKNIVHRDIKPSNIMIARDGTAKLADMGLARSVDDTLDTSITRDGTTVGTVDYMAPEQAANSKAADIRSDIYSLGCTWYHMLTGSPPFNQGGVTEKLTAHARKAPPDPREKNDRVSEAIVAVLHRMMAKKQEGRYQTPEELLADLNNESLLRGGSPSNLLAMLTEDDSHFNMNQQNLSDSSGAVIGDADSGQDYEVTTPASEKSVPRRSKQQKRSKKQSKISAEQASSETREVSPESGEDPKAQPQGGKSKNRKQSRPNERDDSSSKSNRKRGTAAQRETPNELEGSPARQRAKSGKSNKKTASSKVTQQTNVPSKKTDKTKRPQKTMPPRQGESTNTQPSKPKASINIDIKKMGLVLLAIGGLVIGGWWIVDFIGRSGDGGNSSPYANGNPPPGPPEAVPEDKPEIVADPVTPENMVPETADTKPEATQPEAVVTQDVLRVDFPGITESGAETGRLQELLPEWVLSGWGMPDRQVENVITIGRGRKRNKPPEFPSLQSGLEKVPVTPTTIELAESSIFSSGSIEIERCQHLIIKAAADRSPVVHINTNQLDDSNNWLTFGKGTLELDGIHFVITSQANSEAAATLLQLRSANLVVRNCTFTTIKAGTGGNRQPQSVTVVNVQDQSPQGNRVLWENCSARGEQLSILNTAETQFEMVAGNCLFATTGANLFQTRLKDAAKAKAITRWSFLGCTLMTNRDALHFSQVPAEGQLPQLSLDLYGCLFVAGPSGKSTAVNFQHWPLNSATDLNAAIPMNVKLDLENSRFSGWQQLSSLIDKEGGAHVATDDASWRQFWRQQLPSDDLLHTVNGLNKSAIDELSLTELATLINDLSNGRAGARSQLGCHLDELTELQPAFKQRFLTAAHRRRLPSDFGEGMRIQKTVRFDLKRVSGFQEFLESADCPDGTHVICVGSGLVRLPSITLSNRKLRIEFEQSTDAPLILRPPGNLPEPYLFAVDGGQLDLVNANVELPDSGSRKYPATFIKSTNNAQISLRKCQAKGPLGATSRVPLLDLAATEAATANYSISDSVLIAKGPVLSVNLASSVLEIDNSLVVSGNVAINLRSGDKPGSILLHHCTLSSSDAVIHCSGLPTHQPLDLFVKNCVFAPSLSLDGTASTESVLSLDDERLIGTVLRWWESGSAYSAAISHCLKLDESLSGNDYENDWQAEWGAGHIVDELYGSQAVTLQEVLGDWENLQPGQFTLQGSCQSAIWSETFTPIGIDVANIGPDNSPPQEDKKPEAKPNTKPGTAPTTRPNTKPKGPDF